MKPAFATTICTAILPWFPPHKYPPSCLKFKGVQQKRLFPLDPNNSYSVQAFLARFELAGASAKRFGLPSRTLARFSTMGELGQEDMAVDEQVGRMEMGIVLPATEIHVEKAAKALQAGQVVAVPTDTLYGLACDACALEETRATLERFGFEEAS